MAESIIISDTVDEKTTAASDVIWMQAGKCTLLLSDKEHLLTPGFALTDKHINFVQTLLRNQYPGVCGLTSTLLQYKFKLSKSLQIIHCHTCHWVMAYKEDSSSDAKVYDSSFKTVIMNLFEAPKIKMA